MISLEKIKNLQNQKLGFFRFKKFDEDTYLITNDVGKYSFLSKEDFWTFLTWELTDSEKIAELTSKKFLKNDTYEADSAVSFRKKNNFLNFWPTLHIVVTTLRCNHKCQYCHAAVAPMTAKEMDMTQDTAQKVVDTIFYTSALDITIEFQGGESLVNWDIVKFIVEYAEVKAYHLWKNVTFALVSNLTLMDDEKFDYIVNHNIHISTSLDGDEDTHNFNRTFKDWNSFEKVTHWIKKINEKYSALDAEIPDVEWKVLRKVWALLTVTKKTLSRHKEVIDTYVGLWLDAIFLRPLNPYGFAAAEIEKLGYTDDEFIEYYRKSMDYIIEINKKGTLMRENLSAMYLIKILTDSDPNYLDERSPCWACIWQVAYNYDGKIYSCDEWRMLARMWDQNFFMADVHTTSSEKHPGYDTYKAMITSETTKVMVQASTLDGLPWYNDSVYKPYIWVCPIHSYKTSWNLIPNYSIDHKRKIDYAILDYIFEKIRDPEVKEIFEKWIRWPWAEQIQSQCDII